MWTWYEQFLMKLATDMENRELSVVQRWISGFAFMGMITLTFAVMFSATGLVGYVVTEMGLYLVGVGVLAMLCALIYKVIEVVGESAP